MTQPAHVQTSRPQLKLGRLSPHPETTHPRLKLADFLTPGYALTVPPAVDYLSKVTTWPIYANDQLGDCTAAAAGHMREAWTCYAQGATLLATDADILTFYEATSGYVPGHPNTDNGAVMQDCLSYWRKTGLAGDKILAFFQIDPSNLAEVKTALYTFGGIYVGVDLPNSALDQFEARQAWDYNPRLDNNIAGGHCVHLGAIGSSGFMTVTTWGRTQTVTPAWWSKFTEESWAAATLDWVKNNMSPEGLDTTALNAEFQALTGQPGPFPISPTPTPAPPPSPTPVPVSAADQALAAAIPASWLGGYHVGNNEQVCKALQAWFAATGLKPAGQR